MQSCTHMHMHTSYARHAHDMSPPHTYHAHLWRLSRTYHAPVSIVQLARSCQLSVSPNRGVEPAQVGEGGGEGQAIEHLGDPSTCLVGLSLVSPVPSGQRVLQTVSDGARLDSQLQVEVLPGRATTPTVCSTCKTRDASLGLTRPLSMNFWAYSRTSLVKFRKRLKENEQDNNYTATVEPRSNRISDFVFYSMKWLF